MKKIFQSTQCLSLEEIQSYTKGIASEELRYKVENHIVDCPLCAEATEGYAMPEVEDEDFSTIFQKIEARTIAKASPARTKRIIPWNSIAASLLFLLTVGAAWTYYQSDQSKNNYQAYFEKGENSLATRAIDQSRIPQNMLSGIKLYQSKNFHGSLSFFEDYLQSNPESTIGSYYGGMSA